MTIAPQVVGSPSAGESNNVASTTLTIPKPSTGVTVQDGDILVAFLRCGSSAQTTDYALAGWTRRGLGFSSSNATVRVTGIFTHYVSNAAGEPASYAFALAGNAFARQTGMMVVVRPGVGAAPWGSEPAYTAPTAFTNTPPAYPAAVSGLTADALALHAQGNETVSPGAATWTPPTGSTTLGAHGSLTNQADTSATRSVVAAAYEVITGTTAGGSTKAGTWPSYSSTAAAMVVIPGTAAATTTRVVKTHPLSWDVAARVLKTHAMSWDVAGATTRVVKTHAMSWDVRARVVKTHAISWSVADTGALSAWLARPGPKWCAHRSGFKATYGPFTVAGFNAMKAWNPFAAWNIDVVRTSDGEWMASHDLDTVNSWSGANATIASTPWATLAAKTSLTGSGEHPARLDDIVAIAPAGTVYFIDNKANINHAALVAKLASLGLTPANVVYKIGSSSTANFTSAKANGFTTWSYAFDADMATMASNIGSTDWVGFDYAGTQANWNTVIGYGKPSFAHILATQADKTAADTKAAAAGGSNFGYMVTDAVAVIPQRVIKTHAISWDVRARVVKSHPISWDVAGATTRVVKTHPLSWDVRARVTKSHPISWDVRARVIRSHPMSWDVRARVLRTHALSWSVAGPSAGGVAYSEWTGSAEVPITVTWWNGATERPVASSVV